MSADPGMQAFVHATQLYFRGDLRAALDELSKAEQLALAGRNEGLLAGILIQRASWLRERGQTDERSAVLTQIDQLVPLLKDDDRNMALTFLRLEQAIEASRAANFDKAEKLLCEAETEARKHHWGLAILSDVLANLGGVYLSSGHLKDAQTKLQEAIQIDRQFNNQRALANDLNILALTYHVSGDHATADLYFKQALETARHGGFLKEAADAVHNSAIYLEEAGRFDEAQAGCELALMIYEQIGNQVTVINVKSSLAIIALKRGDARTARHLLTETVANHEKVGDQDYAVCDLINLAVAELILGEADSAYAHATKACDQAHLFGMLDALWRARWSMAQARAVQLKSTSDSAEKVKGLNEALVSYEEAAEALELLRAGIGRPEERQQFLLNKEDLYGGALYLAGFLRRPDIAFAFSERARAPRLSRYNGYAAYPAQGGAKSVAASSGVTHATDHEFTGRWQVRPETLRRTAHGAGSNRGGTTGGSGYY